MPRISLPRNFTAAVFVAGLVCMFVAPAARGAVQSRIAGAVSSASRVEVADSIHPKVRLSTDLGAAPSDTKLQGMTIRFTMTAAQQAALDQLLANQQNPSSPQYHQWLTPTQFAAQFGLSSDDIAKVSAWLSGQGFTVTGVAHGGSFVTFDGTVGQVQTAFSTSIHKLSLEGETLLAYVTNISVPIAMGGVVQAVTGLHNFRMKPRIQTNAFDPKFTSSVTGNHFMAPGDFYVVYNEQPLLTKSINGTGATIAIMGQTDIIPTDIATFRSLSGLAANQPIVTVTDCDPGIYNNLTLANESCDYYYGPPTSDDLAEASLDLEWSGAVAPAATILFINSVAAIPNSITYAIDNNVAPIISVSYGACESAQGTTELNALNQLFKQANAQGESVVAPAGDNGAADCDSSDTSAIQGQAVDFPGSSPYVTSMGGTQFNGDAAATCVSGASCNGTTPGDYGSTTYWNGTPNSTDVINTALSYIPEAVWNENSTGSTFSATGGGPSAFFSKPAWQTGTGVPNDGARDTPDLALNSAPGHDEYVYCAAGSCAVGFRETANGTISAAGGTSFATPTFAGILALVEQQNNLLKGIGNPNPTIYAMANLPAYYSVGQNFLTLPTVVFNDVTTGNNNDPCTAETPNCAAGGSIGFNAGNGYDESTGWGSVNISNFSSAWSAVKPLGSGTNGSGVSTTTLVPFPNSVAAGATVTLTATVTGAIVSTPLTNPLGTTAGPTPTGTVQFLLNGTAIGTPVALNSSGVATYTYTTSCSNLAQLRLPGSPSATAGSAQYAATSPAGRISWLGAGSGATLACLFLFTFPRKRRINGLLLVVLSIALIGGASGCGGGAPTVASSGSSTSSVNGLLVVEASYSGDSNYAGSIAGGVTTSGFTTSTSRATPISVVVTQGTCTI